MRAHVEWLGRGLAKDELLQSIPGVGPAVSRALLAALPELGTLGRPGRAGAAEPRQRPAPGAALPQGQPGRGALGPVHGGAVGGAEQPSLRAFAGRLRVGKAGQVRLVALARELGTVANAVLRDGREAPRGRQVIARWREPLGRWA